MVKREAKFENGYIGVRGRLFNVCDMFRCIPVATHSE